jgi:hypothetical protein
MSLAEQLVEAKGPTPLQLAVLKEIVRQFDRDDANERKRWGGSIEFINWSQVKHSSAAKNWKDGLVFALEKLGLVEIKQTRRPDASVTRRGAYGKRTGGTRAVPRADKVSVRPTEDGRKALGRN